MTKVNMGTKLEKLIFVNGGLFEKAEIFEWCSNEIMLQG